MLSPERLGKVTPIAAGSFPLTRQHASRYVDNGVIFSGGCGTYY